MMTTRREFLSFAGAGTMALGVAPLLVQDLRTPAGVDGLLATFRRDQPRGRSAIRPTGLGRDDYLTLIRGIVRFFAGHQDARGAIIDPYEGRERQYSTPAFALAAAALCGSSRDADLLPAAIRAMEAASADLADGKAADGHADFFTVLLVHADLILRRLAPAPAVARWRGDLVRVVPERVYRQQPTAKTVSNWNLVAVAGEWLRTREGFGQSRAWVSASLARQVVFFTPQGMYRDPNDPMAYDHFARLWALDLVEEGYAGPESASLQGWIDEAARLSLFMQSPNGELPCGGRSAHHQWNEAGQAVTFETFARRYARRGDAATAGAFKRAARLSLQSVARWVRPSGELWIVKNRMDPALRHGYESYSFHSQYNLLTAAMLALAWQRADERVTERACPADVGGYAFALQPAFHKVFAAARGCCVEIDTGADLHFNPTGIIRVHRRGLAPETLSDGVTPECQYTVPAKPSRAMAFGPEWRDADGRWHALAAHAGGDLAPTEVRVVRASPELVEVELAYRGRLRGGATGVRQTVRVSPSAVDVDNTVEGEVRAVREVVPFLVSDGQTETTVTLGGGAEIVRGGGRLSVMGSEVATWTRAGAREPCRNGFMDAVHLEVPGRSVRCRVGEPPSV